MTRYEYKVVPAPRRGLKGKGIKGMEARFAYAIQTLMNKYSSDGWEYVRAETLPSDERHGLTSSQTVYRDVLVFRRARTDGQPPLHERTLQPAVPVQTDESPEDLPDEFQPDDIQPDDIPDEADAPDAAFAESDDRRPDDESIEDEGDTAGDATFGTTRRD